MFLPQNYSLANPVPADCAKIAAPGKQPGIIREKGYQARLTAGEQTHLELRRMGRKAVVDAGVIDRDGLAMIHNGRLTIPKQAMAIS